MLIATIKRKYRRNTRHGEPLLRIRRRFISRVRASVSLLRDIDVEIGYDLADSGATKLIPHREVSPDLRYREKHNTAVLRNWSAPFPDGVRRGNFPARRCASSCLLRYEIHNLAARSSRHLNRWNYARELRA